MTDQRICESCGKRMQPDRASADAWACPCGRVDTLWSCTREAGFGVVRTFVSTRRAGMILDATGKPHGPQLGECTHGVTFDEPAARGLDAYEVRRRWPRLDGRCPLGCGYCGIAYASGAHYVHGDW